MKQIVILALLMCTVACRQKGDPRLYGTFVSDRAATMAYLKSTGKYDDARLAKLGALFGHLQVTYSGNTATTVFHGETETEELCIVDSGENYVLMAGQFGDEATMGSVIMITNRVEFVDDGYWVTSPFMEDLFREKFVRKEVFEARKNRVPEEKWGE